MLLLPMLKLALLSVKNLIILSIWSHTATDLLNKIHKVIRNPLEKFRAMFAQIISTVSWLDQNNIVSQDRKCENVLLMDDNQLKKVDTTRGGVWPVWRLHESKMPTYQTPIWKSLESIQRCQFIKVHLNEMLSNSSAINQTFQLLLVIWMLW